MKMPICGYAIRKTGFANHTVIGMRVEDRGKARAVCNYGHMACCYIYIKDDEVYVGQTRYFDSRLRSYFRNTKYKDGHLFLLVADKDFDPIAEVDGDPLGRENFGEEWLQQLEHMFIHHFKECCWGTNYKLENSKSETPSVGSPKKDADFHAAFKAFRRTLLGFSFPLNTSTPKISQQTNILYTQNLSDDKFYQITVDLDTRSKLLRVRERSIGINQDNAAHYQYKKLQRLLKREKKCIGKDKKLHVRKPWTALKLQEIVGAMSNSAGPLVWYQFENDKELEYFQTNPSHLNTKQPLSKEDLDLIMRGPKDG
jgi:hypothetical protein